MVTSVSLNFEDYNVILSIRSESPMFEVFIIKLGQSLKNLSSMFRKVSCLLFHQFLLQLKYLLIFTV